MLPRSFYLRPDVVAVARALLGCRLVVPARDGARVSGIIVETEAYRGPEDRASHAWNGRRTRRTETMYGRGGTAYVYFVYGMYHQFNVVTNVEGIPHAVLVRALQPDEGIERMRRRRPGRPDESLTSGPGKLCLALGIDRSHDRADLLGPRVFIEPGDLQPRSSAIASGPRVGIDYARLWRHKPWRFWIRGNPFVSRPNGPARSARVMTAVWALVAAAVLVSLPASAAAGTAIQKPRPGGAPPAPRAGAAPSGVTPPIYDVVIDDAFLAMPDGVRLSVTFVKPVPRTKDETFPVLFDLYPYRKDEYPDEYPTYFARRGFIMATADIRGTGSSEGAVPDREYSEQELDDAVAIIGQLATMPGSNGRVGMWGKSWGGFNSIQVAMRRPPALKAILAVMATDDLFHDDVHHMDGAFHLDQFMPEMDHDNTLPRTPAYRLDDDYFRNRFEHYPWLLTYSRHQRDGVFWSKNALRGHYERIAIPCYLIGGLLDGYRDSVPRMLENMKVPMRAAIGPYKHDWPDEGVPGPNYEWRHEAVRFWDHWLKDRDTGIMKDAPLALFLRDGHAPDIDLKTTPGRWIATAWPIPGTAWRRLYPAADRRLVTDGRLPAGPAGPVRETLRYVPSSGVATGLWWGEPTGDMRPDDAGALVFYGPLLGERIVIAGQPRVRLRVVSDAPLAHWVARLEDVQPDGGVSLVTGMLLNGSQRASRLSPEPLQPGKTYDLSFDLHFTTWTFKPGHRIRLAVSNALWPMIWPTPKPMTTTLFLGIDATRIELPVIPDVAYPAPGFLPPQPHEDNAPGRYIESVPWPRGLYALTRELWGGIASLEWKGHGEFETRGRKFRTWERNFYQTSDFDPAASSFSGEAGRTIDLGDRTLDIRSLLEVRSDATTFRITVTRTVTENGDLVRRRTWDETIPRDFN